MTAHESMTELESLAKKGDVEAMKNLGVGLFMQGDGKNGLNWVEKAASKGDVTGLEFIADCLNYVNNDPNAAIPIYEKAVKKGSVISLQRLGLLYYDEKNYKEALKWFEKGMKAGDPYCEYMLGKAYYEGNITKKNIEKGFNLISEAANSGDKFAQFFLYDFYKTKIPGIAEEWLRKSGRNGYDKALDILIGNTDGTDNVYEWYEIKAENGDETSAEKVAKHYLEPDKRDLKKALKYAELAKEEDGNEIKKFINLQKRADSEDVDAMVEISDYYKEGTIVNKDKIIAKQYLEKAAHAGNLKAMKTLVKNRLAVKDSNFNEEIVGDENYIKFLVTLSQQPNPEVKYLLESAQFYMDHGNTNEAFSWWEKAGEIGDGTGYYNIAKAYDEGKGIGKDSQKGFEYYLKGAEIGDPKSMYSVGYAYENGEGVDPDKEMAKEWYKKASDAGDERGSSALDKIINGTRQNILGSNLIRMEKDGEYSVLDDSGNVIVPPGKYAYIDDKIFKYEIEYDRMLLIPVKNESGLLGLIDTKGQLIIPLSYRSFYVEHVPYSSIKFILAYDTKYAKTYYKQDGTKLGEEGIYTDVDTKYINNGYLTVKKGENKGVVNYHSGKEIIPPIFYIFCGISKNGNYLVLDKKENDYIRILYIYSSDGQFISSYKLPSKHNMNRPETLRLENWLNNYGIGIFDLDNL